MDLGAFVERNLERYGETQGVLPERLAAFGETYRERGYLTRDELYEIAYESSTRSAHHVERNPEARAAMSRGTFGQSRATSRSVTC
jgi:transketolase N-terminal domain/subunit